MSDDDDTKKSKSESSFSSGPKDGPATSEPREGIEIDLGESGTLTTTSGSSPSSTATVVVEPEPQPQLAGKYTLKQGDTPFSVALEMYGQGSMGAELRRANRKVAWKTGNVINL